MRLLPHIGLREKLWLTLFKINLSVAWMIKLLKEIMLIFILSYDSNGFACFMGMALSSFLNLLRTPFWERNLQEKLPVPFLRALFFYFL